MTLIYQSIFAMASHNKKKPALMAGFAVSNIPASDHYDGAVMSKL
jgi:hypothetical protein